MYKTGEVFPLEYDLEIQRNSFPKNGKYLWGIVPCYNSDDWEMCWPMTNVDLTFTLGKKEIIEGGENQDISSNLAT